LGERNERRVISSYTKAKIRKRGGEFSLPLGRQPTLSIEGKPEGEKYPKPKVGQKRTITRKVTFKRGNL